MSNEKEYAARCVLCESTFTAEELNNNNTGKCPNCKTGCIPCAPEEDVTIEINWHELRILGMWAENWAKHIKKDHPDSPATIAAITSRLEKQYPDKPPLMLFREINDLKKMLEEKGVGSTVETHNIDMTPEMRLIKNDD